MKTYYKVLTINLQSISKMWYLNDEETPWVIQYKMDKFVYPNPGFETTQLMVFDSISIAKNFVFYNNIPTYVIAKCDVLFPCPIGKHYPVYDLKHLREIINGKISINHTSPPLGTIFCNGIRLTKIIETQKYPIF